MKTIQILLNWTNYIESLWAQWGVRLSRVDWGEEEMESPPNLGLEIINIVPLWKD